MAEPVIAASAGASAISNPPAPRQQQPRVWTKGTLTYTFSGIVVLFLWMMWGDFAWSMKDRATGAVGALMLKSFGVSDFAYGIIMVSFPNFTNIFLCPIISYRSDRHRGRFGRRIPYLMLTTPFVVGGLIGLGLTPQLARLALKLTGGALLSSQSLALVIFCFFWISFDFGNTVAGAIFSALITDVVPNQFIGRFFAMFRAVSLGCAFLFGYFLMGYAETWATWIFIGLGLVYGIGLAGICLKVREGEYPPPPQEEAEEAIRTPGGLTAVRGYFRECFSLAYYRWVILAFVIAGFSAFPVNMYAIFYAKSVGMEMADYGKISAAVCLISFVLSFFLGWCSDRYHPLRTGIAALSGLTVILFIGGFFAINARIFGWIMLLQGIAIMSFNTLMASYAARLFPRAFFAQFNSAMMLLNSCGYVIGAPLLGRFLDWQHNDYPYVFTIGGIFGLIGIGCLIQVYRYFIRYGGDLNYVAPPPGGLAAS